MAASRNLFFSKKRWPLSKYFCLRTFGSREQPIRKLATRVRTKNRRNAGARLMSDSPDGSALNAPHYLEGLRCSARRSNRFGQRSPRNQVRSRNTERTAEVQNCACARSNDSLGNVLVKQGDQVARKRQQASHGGVHRLARHHRRRKTHQCPIATIH